MLQTSCYIKSTHNFKLRLLIAVVMLMLLVGCDQPERKHNTAVSADEAAQQTNEASLNPTSKPTFTLLTIGDSLTEGLGVKQDSNYPAVLQKSLHQQGFNYIEVINSGLSGETSSGLKNRLDWALQVKPDLTILNIGANDAMRGLPLKLTSQNISEIIQRIEASGSQVILAGMQIYNNLGQEYVTGFKAMYHELAQQHNLTLIPFFLEHVAGNPKYNQADMIHPTAEGYQIIVERNVLPVVLSQLQQFNSE